MDGQHMLHQFNAHRFRMWHGKRVGTVPVGAIIYLQDGVRPFAGLTQPIVTRNPWMVEAWINRDYPVLLAGKWTTVKIAGGHLAMVRSLRDGRRQLVADWILLACIDAGLECGTGVGVTLDLAQERYSQKNRCRQSRSAKYSDQECALS
jgi:hypothetical protein